VFSGPLQALTSMFQILLKKGWTDIMNETLSKVQSQAAAAFVAIYFVSYNLLVTVVSVLSVNSNVVVVVK